MKKFAILLVLFSSFLYATKIKELVNVRGIRDNQLIGYGLVVGLNGTGDGSSSKFTQRAIASMLSSVNVRIDAKDIKSKNVAAVMVTATLPPFSRHGDRIDVEVSSIGDAKSISGGTLLLTALKSIDGQIYALAQGNINDYYNDKKKAVLKTTAKIYDGALVERELDYDLYHKNRIELSLKKADFKTAIKIQNAINSRYKTNAAKALDPRTIQITRPANLSMVEFLAMINDINIYSVKNDKIVIDKQSGTIVAGANILISPVVVAQNDFTLKIAPNIKSNSSSKMISMRYGKSSVASVAKVMQKLGYKPKDIISLLITLKRQGAIRADLEVI
ncbi:MAG: flagellar biosynthesis protein FlgI [Sulfurospirillum sp.]|nr:MAG: flagellar biosynthesis protein FlgI [Sulfurospirillum sp.]